MNIEVSVIVPVYNVEKYLSECLDSIIAQDGVEIEIICVNDGSKDRSLEILNQYKDKYSIVKVITQENQGLSGARNTGIKNANGKYTCFLDSDDMLAPGALKKMLDLAEENELDFLTHDAECIYETKELKKKEYKNHYYQRDKSYGIGTGKEIFTYLMEDKKFCDAAWIIFCNSEWLKKNNLTFYPRLIHEDCLFSFQCYMAADKVMHVNERFVIYRVRENSIMTSRLGIGSIYGKIVCVNYFMQYYYTHLDLKTRYLNAIRNWAEQIKLTAQWGSEILNDEEKRQLKSLKGYLGIEAKNMGLKLQETSVKKPVNDELNILGLLYQIKEYKKVAIYGAGIRSEKLFQFLKRRNMEDRIDCFLVTDLEDCEKTMHNIPVKAYDDKTVDRDTYVIISVAGNYFVDIENVLIEENYKNYIVIDDNIANYINNETIKVNKLTHVYEEMRKASKVWVYGAGIVANYLWERIDDEHKNMIEGIIVSNMEDNPSDFNGVPVRQYTSDFCSREDLVIIAVGNALKEEVESLLDDNNHMNYLAVKDWI